PRSHLARRRWRRRQAGNRLYARRAFYRQPRRAGRRRHECRRARPGRRGGGRAPEPPPGCARGRGARWGAEGPAGLVADGTYTVQLRVTDALGRVAERTGTVTVVRAVRKL